METPPIPDPCRRTVTELIKDADAALSQCSSQCLREGAIF